MVPCGTFYLGRQAYTETIFFRGCLNRELMGKVKAENPTLHIGDMRFISMLTGDVPVSATPAGVDAAAKEAEAQHEAASWTALPEQAAEGHS